MDEFIESEIIFYVGNQGQRKIDVFFQNETFWLSQKKMAEVFEVDVRTINEHIKSIYNTDELQVDRTIRKFRIVQTEGNRKVNREVDFYNLDVIIAVGYRVNSKQATQFRIWATQTLKEYVIKGFVLNDERLKQGEVFGKDYFAELLERIREIRASERRFYQKITDIYAQCSADYDAKAEITKTFYATVQNKLHWAITGHTAAEMIVKRAQADVPNMGLTTWKNAPTGKILRTDITFAKNYLSQTELAEFNRIVSMYLDFAENMAKRNKIMNMQDWITKLDSFLELNQYELLKNPGKVSSDFAKEIAEKEFEKFRIKQDQKYISDFDSFAQRVLERGNLGK